MKHNPDAPTFEQASSRANKAAVKAIAHMDEGKTIGKDKETITPALIRQRIVRTMMGVDGMDKKRAESIADSIYDGARNWIDGSRMNQQKKRIIERLRQVHKGKPEAEIQGYIDTVIQQIEKPTKSLPLIVTQSDEVDMIEEARRKERKERVKKNHHRRQVTEYELKLSAPRRKLVKTLMKELTPS